MSLFTFIIWCFQREQSLQFSGKDYHQEFSGDGIVTSKNKKLKTEFQSQKIKTEVPSQPQQNKPLGQYWYLNVINSRFWIKLMHFYSKCNYQVHVHKVFTLAAKVIIISLIIRELYLLNWLDLTDSSNNDSNSFVPVSPYVYFPCFIECLLSLVITAVPRPTNGPAPKQEAIKVEDEVYLYFNSFLWRVVKVVILMYHT